MCSITHPRRTQSVGIVVGIVVVARVGTTHGRGHTAVGPGHKPPNPAPTTAPREGGIEDEVPLQGWALAPAAARPPAAAYLHTRTNPGQLELPRILGIVSGPPYDVATPAISTTMITTPRKYIITGIHLPGNAARRTAGGDACFATEVNNGAMSPIARLPGHRHVRAAAWPIHMSPTPPTTTAPQVGRLEGVVHLRARATTHTTRLPLAVPSAVSNFSTMAPHPKQPADLRVTLQMVERSVGRDAAAQPQITSSSTTMARLGIGGSTLFVQATTTARAPLARNDVGLTMSHREQRMQHRENQKH